MKSVIECQPQPVICVTTEGGAAFVATRGHAFLTLRGWVRTGALTKDDVLLGEHDAHRRIMRIQTVSAHQPVFNLRTEREHNFVIQGGVVAHNYSFLRWLRARADDLLSPVAEPDLAKAQRA